MEKEREKRKVLPGRFQPQDWNGEIAVVLLGAMKVEWRFDRGGEEQGELK